MYDCTSSKLCHLYLLAAVGWWLHALAFHRRRMPCPFACAPVVCGVAYAAPACLAHVRGLGPLPKAGALLVLPLLVLAALLSWRPDAKAALCDACSCVTLKSVAWGGGALYLLWVKVREARETRGQLGVGPIEWVRVGRASSRVDVPKWCDNPPQSNARKDTSSRTAAQHHLRLCDRLHRCESMRGLLSRAPACGFPPLTSAVPVRLPASSTSPS